MEADLRSDIVSAIPAFPDHYLPLLERRTGLMARVWAVVSLIFGLAAIALAQPGFMNA